MGSILPEQMQSTPIHDLAASKLPFFQTAPSIDTTFVQEAHSFTVNGVPIHSSSESRGLLRRFARFVGHVVESDRVTFSADAPEIGIALVQAIIPVQVSSGVISELKINFLAPVTHVDEDVHFKILIAAHNGSLNKNRVVETAQKVPFLLSVKYTQEDKADITLSLRSDYGGCIAAKHLAELAVAYLTSGLTDPIVVGAGLEPSRVNFESFLQPIPQIQHSMSAAASNGCDESNGHADPRLLHTAFEANVRKHPDNIAIEYLCRTSSATSSKPVYYQRDLTYAELDSRAKDLTSELDILLQVLESQWRPVLGDQYAFPLLIPPSPELFIAMLAVLKSGHSFSSLPADAPPERLRAIVEDLGAPIVLGVGEIPWYNTRGPQPELDWNLEKITWVDITNPAQWRKDRNIPDITGAPGISIRVPAEEDLCYLFYTSGSTGKPKGVLGSHRSALTCVESTLSAPLSHLSSGPRLRWLNLSAPSFDPMIIDTFVPLSLGGVLCAAERDLLLTDVEACARELRATASYAVASLALLMRPEHMPTLKTLIVGGESVNGRVIEKFAPEKESIEDDRRLINAYGPTETTIFCTVESCTKTTRSSVIGDALSSAFFLIADPESLDAGELRETPLGLAGELIVGGPQVACGYLNRPKETARVFIPANKFPELGLPFGITLYRTGDKTRVVWSADGKRKIDFLGRISTDQVKLNGRRVELTEIENTLTSAQGVAAVAVVVVKNREGGRAELVAFLTVWTDEDRQCIEGRCRTEAKRLLPEWMCPDRYIILDQLPWTASGKVDRGLLARFATGEASNALPMKNGSSTAIDSTAENNKDIESFPMDSSSIVGRSLIAALGDHTANSDPAITLLSLGLDSLRTMRFLQSVRDYGIENLTMHEVLSSRTVGNLIKLVESKSMASKLTTVEKICVDEVDVAEIPIDSKLLYGLPISTKLRHFSHYCLTQCISNLKLASSDIEQVLPATNAQIRLLYSSTRPNFLDPTRYSGRPQIGHFVYNLPLDKLDPDRLKHAVDIVLRRHDCFRTVFCSVQHPLSPFAVCITRKDSECTVPKTVEIVCKFNPDDTSLWNCTLVSAQRAAEAAMSIDRPGVTVTWIRSPDNAHHIMILSLAHQIFDGVMLTHLREEIAAEYADPNTTPGILSLTDKSTKLPLLPMRTTIELLLRGTDWAEPLFFWMKRFAGVPIFRFGSTRPAPQAVTLDTQVGMNATHMRSSAIRSSLSMDELSTGAASKVGTTMAAIVQAAWSSVLAQTHKRVTVEGVLTNGRLDVQFGSVLHGRHTQDLWRCMAPLLTTVPMHFVVEVDGQDKKNPTNREACTLLAAQHLEVAPYIDVPCPTLDIFDMGFNRFDTLLNLQTYRSNTAASAKAIGDSTPRDLPGWNPAQNLLTPYKEIDTGFPVMMEVWPAFDSKGPDWSGKMTLKCTYNMRKPGYEFLSEEWVAGLLNAFEDALVRVLREPDGEFYIG